MVFSSDPVRVQPYFGFRNDNRLILSARALKAGEADFNRSGRWRAMRTMMSQFASREVAGLVVQLELERPDGERIRYEGITNAEGFVHFDIALEGTWSLGAASNWEVVSLHWNNVSGTQCAEGHVLAPSEETRLGVISDIDDTILETGITGGLRNLLRNMKRVIAHLPDERIAVPGADTFYSALGGAPPSPASDAKTGERLSATQRPFFYISSSPWNLFSYLVAFKRSRNLPLGPIMLRDWGFNRETLGSSSHGAHKREAIDRVLETYPDMRFALIGDDTQGDFAAFGETVRRHPSRIAAVFIRKAAKVSLDEAEMAAKALIEKEGVPLWLGDDYSTGRAFLKTIGLDSDGEAEQIIETVERGTEGVQAE